MKAFLFLFLACSTSIFAFSHLRHRTAPLRRSRVQLIQQQHERRIERQQQIRQPETCLSQVCGFVCLSPCFFCIGSYVVYLMMRNRRAT